jgi:hypothetical protein
MGLPFRDGELLLPLLVVSQTTPVIQISFPPFTEFLAEHHKVMVPSEIALWELST